MKKLLLWTLIVISALGMLLPGVSEAKVPELNLSVKPMPDSLALAFTRSMGIGWCLGNTFDATGGSWIKNEMDIETAWHRDKTTEAMIEAVHSAGFDTIRIPVSWHDHVDADFNITPAWLDRVQEVVNWAYERGMYVIINIHHDCEKAYYYPDEAHLENSTRYVTAIWTQVGERFKDYDEHIIFENLNEPRLKDTQFEWNSDAGVPEVAKSMECINSLNQTFVDTVRAQGGVNASRYLMVSGYDAAVEGVLNDVFALPEDSAQDRLIISTHAYAPYDFCLQLMKDGGRDVWSIDSNSDKALVAQPLEALYQRYIVNGIPVVMGEFANMQKGNNLPSRVEHAAFYTASASIRGIPCVWWDNNAFSGGGELLGIFRRSTLKWEYPEILEALMKYKLS
ncbi:MAG: glycoside hydrolase family 5 protein [Clostridia bacterium]|nr:glycoside hydrolase family 5 protein [Clostridia bacterium]